VEAVTDDLVAFLKTQWDDEEADARWSLENAPAAYQTDPNSMNFSPERVLREIEAKRRILDEYTRLTQDFTHATETVAEHTRRATLEDVLALLAEPYAGEDGYKQQWKPV
jgi:hypothetical protein